MGVVRDGQGFQKPLWSGVKVEICTLDKPLPLTKGTSVFQGYAKGLYIGRFLLTTGN